MATSRGAYIPTIPIGHKLLSAPHCAASEVTCGHFQTWLFDQFRNRTTALTLWSQQSRVIFPKEISSLVVEKEMILLK